MARDISSILKYAPKEWREQFEEAANVPFRGPMQDEHGVIHEIFGNFTACGKQWAGQTRYGHTKHLQNWTTPPEDSPFTCFACLRDIRIPEG